jgi:CRISP-associated protein Cas1
MRILNTLYLTEPGLWINARQQSIEVRRDRSLVARFPLEGLEGVIVGSRCEVSTATLARCVSRGIRVSQLAANGKLKFAVSGPTRGNVMLRIRQYESSVSKDSSLALAQSFVAAKLQNQRRCVMRWSWDSTGPLKTVLTTQRERIEHAIGNVATARDGDHLRGIEGNGARAHFTAFGAHLHRVAPELSFTSRTRRPPLDPVNALLSYLYGLAVSEAIGALDSVGLDPQIGFLHDLRPGRPSLALDLVEESRPILDRFAARLLGQHVLARANFDRLASGAFRLNEESRSLLLKKYEEFRSEELIHPLLRRQVVRSNLVLIQATLLARTVRGDLDRYPPFVMEA